MRDAGEEEEEEEDEEENAGLDADADEADGEDEEVGDDTDEDAVCGTASVAGLVVAAVAVAAAVADAALVATTDSSQHSRCGTSGRTRTTRSHANSWRSLARDTVAASETSMGAGAASACWRCCSSRRR